MINFKDSIGLLVAGNFTGHLEQAGEASDFTNTKVENNKAPKGLIPFYVPEESDHFLTIYPLSDSILLLPNAEKGIDVQIEPEIVLVCDLEYSRNDKKVDRIIPKKFGVFNDASIRNKEVPKISYKKNWGVSSQGISNKFIGIDNFAPEGNISRYRLASFLQREGEIFEYGEDSYVKTYSYFYEEILNFSIDKINNQKNKGPLEDIYKFIKSSNFPNHLVLSIGATRYMEYGESAYLKEGDVIYVVAYDSLEYDNAQILDCIEDDSLSEKENLVFLQQVVKNVEN